MKVVTLIGVFLVCLAIGVDSFHFKKKLKKKLVVGKTYSGSEDSSSETLTTGSSNLDFKRSCTTVMDDVWEEKCETLYNDKCKTTYDNTCTSVKDVECTTLSQEECSIVFEDKCTSFNVPYCDVEMVDSCRTEEECTPVTEKECVAIPKRICSQVPDGEPDFHQETPIPQAVVESDIVIPEVPTYEDGGIPQYSHQDSYEVSLNEQDEIRDELTTSSSDEGVTAEEANEEVNADVSQVEEEDKYLEENPEDSMETRLEKRSAKKLAKVLALKKAILAKESVKKNYKVSKVNSKYRKKAKIVGNVAEGLFKFKTVCKETHERSCYDKTRQACKNVQKCSKFPQKSCGFRATKKCAKLPTHKCTNVPKEVCKDVPRSVCRNVPREVCLPYPEKSCKKIIVKRPREECTPIEIY